MATATRRAIGQPFNPYKAFIGLFIPEALAGSRIVTPAAKIVYGHLTRRAGDAGMCFPSTSDIALHVGCSERHCVRLIRELEAAKLVRKTTRRHPSGRTTSHSFEFLWHAIFDGQEEQNYPQREDDVPVTLPTREDDASVTHPTTPVSPSGVTSAPPSFMKRETGSESLKEEERFIGSAVEAPPSSGTPKMEVRAFLAANLHQFLDHYPGGGGKPGALNAAIAAYGRDTADVPVAEWWSEVLRALDAYCGAMRGKEHRDAKFWFDDDFHRRSWGRRPQRQRSASEDLPSSPPPPPPPAVVISDQAAVLPDPDPPRVPLPDRSRVLEMPSTSGASGARSRTNCRRCGGTGVVEAPDISHWTELERAGLSALEVIERCRQVVKACGCRALGTPQSISVRSVG